MSHIFVSYASEERDRIMPVVRALEATGWSVFWDRTIPVGETWQKIIGAEIEACRCMVVIWSATSINKEWVYEEASEGKRRGVLAPVLIDDIIPPIGFRSIQAAKLEGWDGKAASAEFDRLVKDISHMLGTPPIKIEEQKQQANLDAARRDAALQLAREYDQIRREMSAGDERTRVMEGVFSRMKIEAPKVQGLLTSFEQNSSAGVRLMAIAVLNMFPDASHLDWLAERLDPEQEKPFVAYHAAVALLDAVINLPSENCAKLGTVLANAKRLALRLQGDPDRLNVLSRAEQELARKCEKEGR